MRTKAQLVTRIKELKEKIEWLESRLDFESEENERLIEELAITQQELWDFEEYYESPWDYDDLDDMEGNPDYD